MPIIDDEVKEWFMAMCQEFANAKFIVQDTGAKESAAVFLPICFQTKIGWTKQFATIQYMGGSTVKSAHYETFEIRFYQEGLQKARLEDIIEAKKSMRKEKWNGPNPYYHYNIYDIDDFNRYIRPIVQQIGERFKKIYEEKYSDLPVEAVPGSLKDLPRYGPKRK